MRKLLAVLLLVSLGGLPAEGADKRKLTVDDLFALKQVGAPHVSPDGKWVVYAVETATLDPDQVDADLFMAPTSGGDPIQLTNGPRVDSEPRFSPDGRWIAFLGTTGDDPPQVWLLNRAGGDAQVLTSAKGGVSACAWSPDSSRLALIVCDPPDEEAETKATDDAPGKPFVISRLQFKRDGEGYLDHHRAHLHIIDIATKTTTQLTSGPFDDSEPAWSPDGHTVAFTSNRYLPDADLSQNTDIFLVPATGGVPRPIVHSERAESAPVFSPDGDTIACVVGGDPKDMWYGAGHLALTSIRTGTTRPIGKDLDRNLATPRFSPDGRWVYAILEDRGTLPLVRFTTDNGAVERVVTGDLETSAYGLGPDNAVVVLAATFTHPAELFRLTTSGKPFPDGLTRITRVNDQVLAGIELASVTRFVATSPDGTPVDGFLTLPPRYATGTRIPAILRIHGGPAWQFPAAFDFEWQFLAANGYAVIASNPRGSTGYGTAFSRAIWADWGNKDSQDVLAAIGHVVKLGIADPDRLGVGGWSYGGILTNHVLTRTTRFKAATSGAGIANVFAGYGTDQYQYEYELELGLPWEARDIYSKVSSSYFDVAKITTPTLYLCGQLDMNVPLLNNEQLYQAVRRLNKVPTELVVYPGQWHEIATPSHRKDLLTRYVAWYDRFLKSTASQAELDEAEAVSFSGRPLMRVEFDAATKKTMAERLETATAAFLLSPDTADTIIRLGRVQAAAGDVTSAIATFSRGISKFSKDARFYRHRGHRYLTLRQPLKAVADLEKAVTLISGKPDEPEPSTADPATPSTETLHFSVWYHLGLARYLLGRFDTAAQAYRECLALAGTNADMLASATDWLYLSLRRAGRPEEANAVLARITPELPVKESRVYLDRLLMYKGTYAPEDLLRAGGDDVTAATYGYAVGVWFMMNGKPDAANAVFTDVTKGRNWMAFGYLAAERELSTR